MIHEFSSLQLSARFYSPPSPCQPANPNHHLFVRLRQHVEEATAAVVGAATAKIVQDQLTDEPGMDPSLGAHLTNGLSVSEIAGPRKGLQRPAEANARRQRRNKERQEAKKTQSRWQREDWRARGCSYRPTRPRCFTGGMSEELDGLDLLPST